jgi:hypothetical protein
MGGSVARSDSSDQSDSLSGFWLYVYRKIRKNTGIESRESLESLFGVRRLVFRFFYLLNHNAVQPLK